MRRLIVFIAGLVLASITSTVVVILLVAVEPISPIKPDSRQPAVVAEVPHSETESTRIAEEEWLDMQEHIAFLEDRARRNEELIDGMLVFLKNEEAFSTVTVTEAGVAVDIIPPKLAMSVRKLKDGPIFAYFGTSRHIFEVATRREFTFEGRKCYLVLRSSSEEAAVFDFGCDRSVIANGPIADLKADSSCGGEEPYDPQEMFTSGTVKEIALTPRDLQLLHQNWGDSGMPIDDVADQTRPQIPAEI